MIKAIKGCPLILFIAASIRLCMGSRRGFICRMKMGNMEVNTMSASHTHRARQRNTLGPSPDGNHYTVVHVTGYIKNWPPSGKVINLQGICSELPLQTYRCTAKIVREKLR